MKRIEPVVLIAGLGFYALAMTTQGVLPLLEQEVTRPTQVRTVHGTTIDTPRPVASFRPTHPPSSTGLPVTISGQA